MSIIVNGIELTEVIYAGVNLDIVKVKKGTAEAVTVFEKITQLATPQNVTADGTVVSWDEVENATSYEVLADGASIGMVEAKDELAGTWVFNDNIIATANLIKYAVNFLSNNESFIAIRTPKDETSLAYFRTDEDFEPVAMVSELMGQTNWTNTAYKTITITSKLSEVTNGEQLLAWLQANATKQ